MWEIIRSFLHQSQPQRTRMMKWSNQRRVWCHNHHINSHQIFKTPLSLYLSLFLSLSLTLSFWRNFVVNASLYRRRRYNNNTSKKTWEKEQFRERQREGWVREGGRVLISVSQLVLALLKIFCKVISILKQSVRANAPSIYRWHAVFNCRS